MEKLSHIQVWLNEQKYWKKPLFKTLKFKITVKKKETGFNVMLFHIDE